MKLTAACLVAVAFVAGHDLSEVNGVALEAKQGLRLSAAIKSQLEHQSEVILEDEALEWEEIEGEEDADVYEDAEVDEDAEKDRSLLQVSTAVNVAGSADGFFKLGNGFCRTASGSRGEGHIVCHPKGKNGNPKCNLKKCKKICDDEHCSTFEYYRKGGCKLLFSEDITATKRRRGVQCWVAGEKPEPVHPLGDEGHKFKGKGKGVCVFDDGRNSFFGEKGFTLQECATSCSLDQHGRPFTCHYFAYNKRSGNCKMWDKEIDFFADFKGTRSVRGTKCYEYVLDDHHH